MSNDIRAIDSDIRRLHEEVTGLRGAVLREADPAGYQAKREALAEATRAYYRFYFDVMGASMP